MNTAYNNREYQCNKGARNRNIPPCCDTLVLSDTMDSETEFDFGVIPPAGVIKPEKLKRQNFVNTGTQYEENDWNAPPLYPKEPNKYMKLWEKDLVKRLEKDLVKRLVLTGPEVMLQVCRPLQACGGPCGGGGGVGGFGGGGAGKGKGGKGADGQLGVGGRGGKGVGGKGAGDSDKGRRKVDMMRYLSKSKGQKLSPPELVDKRQSLHGMRDTDLDAVYATNVFSMLLKFERRLQKLNKKIKNGFIK